MVAVAAGDAQEAARWARKADSLLEDPPLTLLLSAQAAQLGGDEKAAEKYFNAMLEKPETRFLGLRGLLMQAMKAGDEQAALGYVRQAHALRPKTPWVVTNLFELSERTGDYDAAAAALKQAVKIKALPKAEAGHKGAVITLAKAEKARAEGRKDDALALARAADKADPDFLAAAALHARLAVESDRHREAAKVVERSWNRTPSAELAALYRRAAPSAKPLDQVKRFTKLAALNPNHRESHLALAEVSLDAQLWGEARRHLGIVVTLEGEDPARAQVCRLMARLEEAERNDTEAARDWLERAARAPRDPAWVCNNCGAGATEWSVDCGACGAFDSLDWRAPRSVGTVAVEQTALAQITAKPSGKAAGSYPAKAPEPCVPAAVPAAPATAEAIAPPATAPATPALAGSGGQVAAKPAAGRADPAGANGQQPPRKPDDEDDDATETIAVEGSVPPRP